jgi:hypothetical protein
MSIHIARPARSLARFSEVFALMPPVACITGSALAAEAGTYPGAVPGPPASAVAAKPGDKLKANVDDCEAAGLVLPPAANTSTKRCHNLASPHPDAVIAYPDPQAAPRLSAIPIGYVRRDGRIVSGSNPQTSPRQFTGREATDPLTAWTRYTHMAMPDRTHNLLSAGLPGSARWN